MMMTQVEFVVTNVNVGIGTAGPKKGTPYLPAGRQKVSLFWDKKPVPLPPNAFQT